MINKIENEGALLAKFCDPSSKIEQLCVPFLNEVTGTVWATNAHLLLSIVPQRLKGEYPTIKLGKPDEIDQHNTDKIITLAMLDEALAAVPQRNEEVKVQDPIKCTDCNGTGDVEWQYRDKHFNLHTGEFYCPVCQGKGYTQNAIYRPSGRKVPASGTTVQIGKGRYWATDLQILRDALALLGVQSVRMVRDYKSAMCKWIVDNDIYIVFMPLYFKNSNEKADAEIKPKKKGGVA